MAHKLIQIINSLAEAPNEILALSNELWNLRVVLGDWREIQQDTADSLAENSNAKDVQGALLFQVRVKLDELNNLMIQ